MLTKSLASESNDGNIHLRAHTVHPKTWCCILGPPCTAEMISSI